MKKTLLAIIIALLMAVPAFAVGPPGSGSGSGVQTASDCDVAAYYAIGTLCQDTDDGKLYKGTGAAVVELAAGSSGDFLADGSVPMTAILPANLGLQVKNGADSSGFVDFYEDSSNGTSYMRLYGPAALAGNIFLILPDTAGATGGSLFFSSANTLSVAAKGTENQVWAMGGSDIPAWTSTLGSTGTRLTKVWATDIEVTNAIAGSITGNAGTATALAADPANCAAGQLALGVNASGVAECSANPALSTLNLTGANTLALGTSRTNDGKIIFSSGAALNDFLFSIVASNFGANLTWTLPAAAPGGANYLLNVDADGTMGYTDPASLGGYTAFSQFDGETAWRIWYSNADGDVTELALGATGTVLQFAGATSAPAPTTYSLPPADCTENQILKANASGDFVCAADADSGGATAINDIGDAAADGTIAQTGYKQIWTSTLNTAGAVWTMTNTTADLTSDVSFIDFKYTDNGDANGYFLRGYDAESELKWSIGADGAATFGALTATSLTTSSSADPTITLTDSDTADGTAKIYGKTGGDNDVTMTFYVEVAGSDTAYLTLDGATATATITPNTTITGDLTVGGADVTIKSDGVKLTGANGALTILGLGDGQDEDVKIDLNTTANTIEITSPASSATTIDINTLNMVSTGQISGRVPVATDADGKTLAGTDLYGSMQMATGAGTWVIPDVDAASGTGLAFCIYSTTAAEIVIDGNAEDKIRLGGTLGAAGGDITNNTAEAAGDFICLMLTDFASDVAHWTVLGKSGTWTVVP